MNQATLNLPNPEDWMSAAQAAVKIGISRSHLYELMERQRITGFMIGAHRVFWRSEVEEFAKAYKKVKGKR